jgi:hypothetical protein
LTCPKSKPRVYAPEQVYDTEFSGAGGDRIRAWYPRPGGVRADRRDAGGRDRSQPGGGLALAAAGLIACT